MNLELYIAKRLMSKKEFRNGFSRPIVGIAVVGIALGIAVMIVAISVMTGFKKEVSDKVIGFESHLQIVNFDSNDSYETLPITQNQDWIEDIKNIDGIVSINRFIQKAGILKAGDNIHGVIFKGVDSDYKWNFFDNYIIDGKVLSIVDSVRTNDVVISEKIANALSLKTGDSFGAYFIQDPPRMRKFTVSAIYNTQLEDLDEFFVFVDIKHLKKLYDWDDDQISGFEIKVDDFQKLTEYEIKVNSIVGNNFSEDGSLLKVKNIAEEYPGIFSWLSLLDINVQVLLILILIVAGFNMVSGLLVIILERVGMIGIMKSMGARNIVIGKVFIYFAGFLICKGLLWGNIIGIAICLIQLFTGVITLDPMSYYISVVPINLNFQGILLVNLATFVVTMLMMVVPAMIVSKVSPADSVRFN